jgi:hypothetical protein
MLLGLNFHPEERGSMFQTSVCIYFGLYGVTYEKIVHRLCFPPASCWLYSLRYCLSCDRSIASSKVLVTAYFSYFEKIKYPYELTLLSVCLCIPIIVARQRLGKNPLIVARQLIGNTPLLLLGNGSVKKSPYRC